MQSVRRGLGRIADAASAAPTEERPPLRLVEPAAPAAPVSFPLGARTRAADASGRLKFTGSPGLAETLGWEPGSLDAVIVEGWLVLRQPAALVGERSARNSSRAAYSVMKAGAERVTLKPAHLDRLGAGPGAHLLTALAPAAGVLVVVDPVACLSAAPAVVTTALAPDHT